MRVFRHDSDWHDWHGGSGEKDVKSTVSVLNEIGVGGLSLDVATDNEAHEPDADVSERVQLSRLPLEEHFRESSTGQCGDHERGVCSPIGWLWKHHELFLLGPWVL